jgi:hypothetical protein
MIQVLRAERPADHPSREPSDHANVDPRRQMKHPKIAEARVRGAAKPERPSARG